MTLEADILVDPDSLIPFEAASGPWPDELASH
jgi:hypothetical protein